MNDFIDSIILEAALDSRIQDGIVDLKNIEHLQVIAERVYDACEDEQLVNEFVQSFVEEGKYPERQAYNKDGWLVTFPSKEYKDAAIRKKTHFSSDPTHGKGGMNLYYKKKGKQKRQTQQVKTAIQPTDIQQAAAVQPKNEPAKTTTPSPTKTATASGGNDASARADRLSKLTSPEPKKLPTQADKQPQPVAAEKPTPALTPSPDKTTEPSVPQTEPAIDVPVITAPPEQYSSISKKFAVKKGWISEPYGEYRDAEGNPVAVVGLSGEIVPIRNNDREEYKLFAEKNMS